MIDLERVAAFSFDSDGGNPAGVALLQDWIDETEMQAIAAEIGYSETVFAVASGDQFEVRYFAPDSEVAFCGHATIGLGAVLAERFGNGVFAIETVAMTKLEILGVMEGDCWNAGFCSAPCEVRSLDVSALTRTLEIFGLSTSDLDSRLNPTLASAGLDHLIVFLSERSRLRGLGYEFEHGLVLAKDMGVTTIAFANMQDQSTFHARNFFPIGGVYEDPATGAAAAAMCGYLQQNGWPTDDTIQILQGEDMGQPCRIVATIPATLEGGAAIEGAVRRLKAV